MSPSSLYSYPLHSETSAGIIQKQRRQIIIIMMIMKLIITTKTTTQSSEPTEHIREGCPPLGTAEYIRSGNSTKQTQKQH
jgi:hypothetical protein